MNVLSCSALEKRTNYSTQSSCPVSNPTDISVYSKYSTRIRRLRASTLHHLTLDYADQYNTIIQLDVILLLFQTIMNPRVFIPLLLAC